VLGSAAAAMALLAGPIAPAGAAPPVAAPAPTAPAPTAPAHPPPPPTVPPARRPPLTARDVAGAPRPDRARNQVEDDRSGARHLLWVPRALLFVPRWGLWLAASPVRGGLYGFERYGVGPRLRQLLSGNGPISVFPTVAREAGHGLTYGIGGGISHHVRANFLFGGEVRQVYDLRLVTHGLLGPRLDLELGGQIQRLQESQFFGIGNGDLEPAGMTSGVDPRVDATAVETRFDQENVRLELAADWVPLASLPALATHLTGAVFDKDLGSTGGSGLVDIAEVYDPEGLVGFDGGARYVYGEARAIYDDRATTSPFVSLAEPSTGWKLEGFAGYAHGLGTDPSRYLRYGVDLQRHIDLYMGDRVLVLRAYLEGSAPTHRATSATASTFSATSISTWATGCWCCAPTWRGSPPTSTRSPSPSCLAWAARGSCAATPATASAIARSPPSRSSTATRSAATWAPLRSSTGAGPGAGWVTSIRPPSTRATGPASSSTPPSCS